MQSTLIKCNKCNKENPLSEMSSYSFRGIVTYNCTDEFNCESKEKLEAIKIKEKERIDKEHREKYKHLPKEEQIKEMYGIDFDDLEEMDIRFRDASIHYYHEDTDEFYSWSFCGKYWYRGHCSLKQYL